MELVGSVVGVVVVVVVGHVFGRLLWDAILWAGSLLGYLFTTQSSREVVHLLNVLNFDQFLVILSVGYI